MAALRLFALALCVSSAAALYSPQQPVTSQWDQRNGKGYAYNVDTSLVPFARTVTGDAPDQITITYQSPTSLVINWVVGDGQNYNSSTTITKPSTAGVQSIVQYSAKGATSELNATGTVMTYDQNYYLPTQPGAQYNYTSGLINHVALTDLLPGTEYYYRVGNGMNWSAPYTFTTLQAVSTSFQPYRIGVLADLGVTANSTITFTHLEESLPDVVVLVGDFNYANNLYTNGSITSNYTGPEQTYQPLWDQFYRWWSTLTSCVPYLACGGNHEYEQDVYNATFNSYNARYNQTSDMSGSGNSRYYSVDLPGIHFITLSPYDDYNTTSAQYQWLQKDLAKFNRTKTPFLVAQWHAPIYNTYVSHYKELECARLAWEPILMQYGVDLVLHG